MFAEIDTGVIYGALGAGLTGIGVAARSLVVKWLKVRENRLEGLDPQGRPLGIRGTYFANFIRLARFNKQRDRLKDPLKFPNVERMLLMVGCNCGGLPDLSKPYSVIAQDSWARDEQKNPEDSYNFRMLVDTGYCIMLAEMVKLGRTVQTTSKMEPSMLRKYYTIEGVVQSVVYLLNIDTTANSILFLSVASYSREFTEQELFLMDMHADRMRAILSRTDDGSDLRPLP